MSPGANRAWLRTRTGTSSPPWTSRYTVCLDTPRIWHTSLTVRRGAIRVVPSFVCTFPTVAALTARTRTFRDGDLRRQRAPRVPARATCVPERAWAGACQRRDEPRGQSRVARVRPPRARDVRLTRQGPPLPNP